MKKSRLCAAAAFAALSFTTPCAEAVQLHVSLLDTLTPDYSQMNVGALSGIVGGGTGANAGRTFHDADFGTLNGTGSTTDASRDSATFRLTVVGLQAHTSGQNEWLFESGGAGNGIGIAYQTGDLITFAQRTGNPINPLSFDATALIGGTFDIVATVIPNDLLRLFVNGSYVGETSIPSNDNDWDGGDRGAFGLRNNSSVLDNTGINFSSGSLSNFQYFHDIEAVPDAGSTLALLGFMTASFAFLRRKLC